MAYVVIVQVHVFFPDNGSLKGKRKELLSLKTQLQRRFGAAVSETDHHDLWQRSTITAALVGRDAAPLERAGDDLMRYVESRFTEVRFERGLARTDEVLGE